MILNQINAMSGFKVLRDASNRFEEELHRVSTELFSAKIKETFEDGIAQKLRDLSLYRSKLRHLRGKKLSFQLAPEEVKDEKTTFSDYGETVEQNITAQQLVKSAAQGHAVAALLRAPDSTLDPVMIERKQKIIASLSELRMRYAILQKLDNLVREKTDALAEVHQEWDIELADMRDVTGSTDDSGFNVNDPMYMRLSMIVDKLQKMCWLVSLLGVLRTHYDWMGDPHGRLQAIKRARQHHTLRYFTDQS